MPHVIVKMYTGRSEEQKKALVDKIVKDVVAITECKERSVSVAIEEIEPAVWAETVYKPDILEGDGVLYKEPGYNPFESEQEAQGASGSLMTYVREKAQTAMLEDTTGDFNAMSWLDQELEDNPQGFDDFFETQWSELSDQEKADRARAIRRVL
jgi:4-oxalocrotonate tautomerase